MESSQFTDSRPWFETAKPMDTQGATCDTFRVKLYGKLHFLKRLKPEFAGDIRYQEALRKEFETGYRLEHSNLVRYISMGDDGILTEYVDGETLTQCLETQPDYFRNKKNTEKFMRQLLDVVSYLHSHQVLHLDLKPDNILLTHIGSDVKLIDLGFCYTDTFADTQGHTSTYAAPEQLSGDAVDVRTDIYAIGRILEELPLHAKYNKVIARCIANNPADRYQTIEELQHALSPHSYVWYIVCVLCIVALCVCFFFLLERRDPTNALSPTVKNDTIAATHAIIPSERSSADHQLDVRPQTPQQAPEQAPSPQSYVGETISQEEKEFLSQPHLHIATNDEFTRYKRQLDDYYAEANRFLDDTANMRLFPSHVAYLGEYQRLIYQTREKIKTDDWFFPLYNSPMNPISTYTRKYKESLEHKAFVSSNMLP